MNNPLALYAILTPICFVILVYALLFSLSPLCSRAQEAPVDAEVAVTPKNVRKRKTTHSDLTHGSFFLRVGAIGKPSIELSTCDSYLNWSFSLFFYYFPPCCSCVVVIFASLSFWTWCHDLHWIGVRFILWDTIRFTLPSHPDRRQSAAPDDLHLYADVLYIHERTGKSI